MRVGLFVPNWVGDAVMATPALRAIREHLGAGGETWGVMRPVVADVLAGTPWLDHTHLFDPRSPRAEFGSRAVVKALRAAQLDAVVLFTHSFRTAWLAWQTGAQRRIGFARHGRSLLLSERLFPRRAGWRLVPAPVIDDYAALATRFGCPPPDLRLELATLPDDEAMVDAAWRRLGLTPGEPVVALNTGGAFGPAKAWPAEYFAALAFRLATQQQIPVVILCGPSERDTARQIARQAGHPRVYSLADEKPSIGLTKAAVRRARLLVTTDSGPRHFAAAFGVPVITLFGPTHQAWSETRYPGAIALQRAVPCGPCQARACPLGHHRCMRELDVAEVYRAAAGVLQSPRPAQAA